MLKPAYFDYHGKPIPIKIIEEKRQNIRFSIAQKSAILRLPKSLKEAEKQLQFERFKEWLFHHFNKNEKLRLRFFGKIYENGTTLTILNKTYTVKILKKNQKTHSAKLIQPNIIAIVLSEQEDSPFLQKSIRQLLSRVVAQDVLPIIEKKVDAFNDRYFKENISGIRLKRNQSNWGSCSSKRNLNFSTRLLFAPEAAIDYVIVHELAHLKEMNHSPKFWKIVAEVMPDYEKQEKWLKENGHLCSF